MAGNIEPDFMFKIIIVGDSGVGKTNILTKFTQNTFRDDSKPTIGVELAIKTFIIDKMIIKTQIWDTAGQERFRAITAAYYRKALGIIMVFDLTSTRSFEHLQNWFKELEAYGEPNTVVLLVGNKSDLAKQREVQIPTIEAFVNEKKCLYLQTSAMTGQNIEEAFNLLVKQVFKHHSSLQKLQIPKQENRQKKLTYSPVRKDRIKSRSQVNKPKRNCC